MADVDVMMGSQRASGMLKIKGPVPICVFATGHKRLADG